MPSHLLIELIYVVLGKQKDIFLPLPQGRQPQPDHAHPVIKIRAQPPFLNQTLGNLIGSAYDPHMEVNILLAANPPHLLFFQYLQQLGLHGGIHGVDLIQKQRSSIGQLKQSFFGFRTGEAAPFRAEKHTLQQIDRDCRAVLGNKRFVFPGAEKVQSLGKQFLSRSGLPIDQGSRIVLCHLFYHALELLHGRILSHNIIQRRLAILHRAAGSPL